MPNSGGHHAHTIEEGVFRIYLLLQAGGETLHFSDQRPDALTPNGLPGGAQKRRTQRISPDHIFAGGQLSWADC